MRTRSPQQSTSFGNCLEWGRKGRATNHLVDAPHGQRKISQRQSRVWLDRCLLVTFELAAAAVQHM
jgi:hypothetical protein